MTGTQDWDALGREISARRKLLRLPQDLGSHGGPSEFTIRRLERSETETIRPKTRTQLEFALKWSDGLVDKILDGTATRSEIDEVVNRYDKAGGAAAVVAGSGRADLGFSSAAHGQAIRPDSISPGARGGDPAESFTLGQLNELLVRNGGLRLGPGEVIPRASSLAAIAATLLAGLIAAERTPAMDEAVPVLTRLVAELYERERGPAPGEVVPREDDESTREGPPRQVRWPTESLPSAQRDQRDDTGRSTG